MRRAILFLGARVIEGHDYTIYSSGPGGRSRVYALLALITAFLTPLAQHAALVLLRRYWGDDWDAAETALLFGGFTALILFGTLINLFDGYLWRTRGGRLLFRTAGLPAPPNLAGEYEGTIEIQPDAISSDLFRTQYRLRIAQTWERVALYAERESRAGGPVRVHSDMASVRIGMLNGLVVLRFVYTFEETIPRRDGHGVMSRQFSGAATFEFRRAGTGWAVTGHFFDDIGRSGQLELKQIEPGAARASA